MQYEEYVALAKEAWVVILKKSITNALVSQLGFISLAPWSFLLGKFLDWVLPLVTNQIEFIAFVSRIDIRVNDQAGDFLKAVDEWRKVKNGTDEKQKEIVFKRLEEKFDAFVVISN